METRHATRTVLLDENRQIAILYVDKLGYYKIPGGGVEAGEDVATAARREVLEEAGCESEIIAELGRVENDIPVWGMHDVSDGFIARVIGAKNSPQFDDYEAERGFQLEWSPDIDTAIAKIEQNSVADPSAAILQARDLDFIKRAKVHLEEKHVEA